MYHQHLDLDILTGYYPKTNTARAWSMVCSGIRQTILDGDAIRKRFKDEHLEDANTCYTAARKDAHTILESEEFKSLLPPFFESYLHYLCAAAEERRGEHLLSAIVSLTDGLGVEAPESNKALPEYQRLVEQMTQSLELLQTRLGIKKETEIAGEVKPDEQLGFDAQHQQVLETQTICASNDSDVIPSDSHVQTLPKAYEVEPEQLQQSSELRAVFDGSSIAPSNFHSQTSTAYSEPNSDNESSGKEDGFVIIETVDSIE